MSIGSYLAVIAVIFYTYTGRIGEDSIANNGNGTARDPIGLKLLGHKIQEYSIHRVNINRCSISIRTVFALGFAIQDT
jgi:hypothetical protein